MLSQIVHSKAYSKKALVKDAPKDEAIREWFLNFKKVSLSAGLLLTAGVGGCLALTSLFWGRFDLGVLEGLEVLWLYFSGAELTELQQTQALVLLEIRLPRVLAALLVGAALAVSGAAFQGLFMNPLVSPSVLGVLSGAAFGAALGMLLSLSWVLVQSLSFVMALVALFLALWLGTNRNEVGLVRLVLAGMIIGSLFTALLSVIKYVADPYDKLPAIVYWLMGSLAMVDIPTLWVVTPIVLLGVGLMTLYGRALNVMSMGQEEARTLGIPLEKVRFIILLVAAVLGAITVSLAGMIGWVGLVIPHLVRLVIGSDNRWVLPFSALVGGIYLLLVDSVARLALTSEIPLGILTALIGLPVFAWLLHRSKRRWA